MLPPHVGASPSHPFSVHSLTAGAPNVENPESQVYTAKPPGLLLRIKTLPFAGFSNGSHSTAF